MQLTTVCLDDIIMLDLEYLVSNSPKNTIDDVRGVTLYRPWPSLVVGLPQPNNIPLKGVENRSWKTNKIVGKFFAIHAGRKWDKTAVSFVKHTFGLDIGHPSDYPSGYIIGIARVTAVVTSADVLPHEQRPFFFGPYGFVLDNQTRIDPVPCSGAQRFWRIPEQTYIQVIRNLSITLKDKKHAKQTTYKIYSRD